MIVLIFVLLYYCILPFYKALARRKEQRNEEDWEHDPRWTADTFSFTPQKPSNYLTDKKYSRMAACSRSSSMRSTVGDPPIFQPLPPHPGLTNNSLSESALKIACPPQYSDLFETGSSLASTPPLYSSKTPSIEIHSSSEMVHALPPPPKKIVKPKRSKKPTVTTNEEEGRKSASTTDTDNNRDSPRE